MYVTTRIIKVLLFLSVILATSSQAIPFGEGQIGDEILSSPATAAAGDQWGDVVDADILPDADSTRDIGATANRFAEGWFDTVEGTTVTQGGTALNSLFVGLGAQTDNTMCRFDSTAGQIQGTGITVDDSNNMSGVGTLSSGVITQSGTTLANTYVGLNTQTDNTLVRFNLTAGQIQGSSIVVDDSDNVSGVGTLSTGVITQSGTTLDATYAPTDGDGIIDQICGHIETPTDKSFWLVNSSAYPFTVNTITAICTSGTISAQLENNAGTALTGCATAQNSWSSAEDTSTCTANNTFIAGDNLELVLSSNSSSADCRFCVKITRD